MGFLANQIFSSIIRLWVPEFTYFYIPKVLTFCWAFEKQKFLNKDIKCTHEYMHEIN